MELLGLVVLPVLVGTLLAHRVRQPSAFWKLSGALLVGLVVYGLIAATIPPPRRPVSTHEMWVAIGALYIGPLLLAILAARLTALVTSRMIPIGIVATVSYLAGLVCLMSLAIGYGLLTP